MEDLRLRLKAWQSGRLEKSGRNATESVMVVDIQSKEEGLWSQHFFEKFQYFCAVPRLSFYKTGQFIALGSNQIYVAF